MELGKKIDARLGTNAKKHRQIILTEQLRKIT